MIKDDLMTSTTTSTTASSITGERRLEWCLAGAAAFGGLAVAVVGSTYGLSNETGVGAGFMPVVAGTFTALGGLFWTLGLMHHREAETPLAHDDLSPLGELLVAEDVDDESEEGGFPDRAGWLRALSLIAVIAVAAVLLPVLGYTLTMLALLTVILHLVSRRRLWIAASVSLAVTLASRLVFEIWLGTALPHSGLFPLTVLGI